MTPEKLKEQQQGMKEDFQNLEWLGDAVLSHFSTEILLDRWPRSTTGTLQVSYEARDTLLITMNLTASFSGLCIACEVGFDSKPYALMDVLPP